MNNIILLHLQVVAAENLVKDQNTEGFSTIVQTLVKNSKYPAILGDDAVTQALARQWLEYSVLCVNYADNATNERRVLKVFVDFSRMYIREELFQLSL